MRIGLISTLATPVLEQGSASVEGLVWLLSREFTLLGHEVTVFAAGGSRPHGRLIASLPGTYGQQGAPGDWQVCEWVNIARAVEASGELDVLHCHSYLYGLPARRLSTVPLVSTMHINGSDEYARQWKLFPDACVTAISRFQWSAFAELRPAAVVPHGVDESAFVFQPEPEDYLCFLGRFLPGKGPLLAIQAARALSVRLVLAGPRSHYYEEHVKPLVDGRSVEYVGWVQGEERARLLGGARALLYPQQAPEPFGLVQVESMMCGTPVAAVDMGAVPEIIDAGVTGYYSTSAADFVQSVERAVNLDRRQVRARAEARYSARRMALEYLSVYKGVCLVSR
jgi:glycosyltransferase involved in cell wall biosynthesis